MFLDFVQTLVAVVILWKCADWFVEGAVGIAERLHVPHMFVGLVLVSIATTSPELMASLLAALQGKPAMALGNAVGSVAIDASVALGLGAAVAAVPLVADRQIFRTSAIVLVTVLVLCFLMTLDGTLSGWEGGVLFAIYVGYVVVSYRQMRRRQQTERIHDEALEEIEALIGQMTVFRIVLFFFGGFAGVLLGSMLLVRGAVGIAEGMGLSDVVVGMIVVAVGTSTPEIATCVASALKRQSGIGVGNIIGADILNICWVAGVSSMAHPLSATRHEVLVMFPGCLIIVLCMLALLRHKYRLTRWKGLALLFLYVAYVSALMTFATSGDPSELHGRSGKGPFAGKRFLVQSRPLLFEKCSRASGLACLVEQTDVFPKHVRLVSGVYSHANRVDGPHFSGHEIKGFPGIVSSRRHDFVVDGRTG